LLKSAIYRLKATFCLLKYPFKLNGYGVLKFNKKPGFQ